MKRTLSFLALLIIGCSLVGCNSGNLKEDKPAVIKTDGDLTNAIKNDLDQRYKLKVTPIVTDFKTLKNYTFASFWFDNEKSRFFGVASAIKNESKWEVDYSSFDKVNQAEKIMNVHRGLSSNTTGSVNIQHFVIEDGYINIENVSKIKVWFTDGISYTQTILKNQKSFLFVREYDQSIKKIEAFNNQNQIIYSKTYP